MGQRGEVGEGLASGIRVLIVDDHSLFAEGLRAVLQNEGIETVAIAKTGSEAIVEARRKQPNLVLLDLILPDMDGLVVAHRLLEQDQDLKILVLTALDDPGVAQDSIRAGAYGCLLKHATATDLVSAIIAAGRSQTVIAHDVVQALVGREQGGKPTGGSPRGPEKQLTQREREILGLLASGATGPEIAAELYLSPNTIRTHVQNILAKLGVHSRLEAVALAARLGVSRRMSSALDAYGDQRSRKMRRIS
jgi:two-component system, NarL family, nitrate/nitrite response regulator NarL